MGLASCGFFICFRKLPSNLNEETEKTSKTRADSWHSKREVAKQPTQHNVLHFVWSWIQLPRIKSRPLLNVNASSISSGGWRVAAKVVPQRLPVSEGLDEKTSVTM